MSGRTALGQEAGIPTSIFESNRLLLAIASIELGEQGMLPLH